MFLVVRVQSQALLERTGYTLDVTTGQRKYGGPPPEAVHSGAQPTIGTEVKTSRLPVPSRCSGFRHPRDDALTSVVTLVALIVYR